MVACGRSGRLPTAVLAGLITVAAVLAGCGNTAADERDRQPGVDYFGDTSFVGRTVTINALVTRIITPRSYEVDARSFGDDTLLVIARPGRDVQPGERLRITGNVEVFHYATYREEYRLAPPEEYAAFTGERFVAAADAGPPGLPSAGADATRAS